MQNYPSKVKPLPKLTKKKRKGKKKKKKEKKVGHKLLMSGIKEGTL